jgi:hypothetical protein
MHQLAMNRASAQSSFTFLNDKSATERRYLLAANNAATLCLQDDAEMEKEPQVGIHVQQ